jgi:peptidoglycan hydrolase-like amidase
MLVEDTEKHLRRSRAVYMPQSVKNQTNCSNNLTDEEKNYNLYKNFQKSITPQEWQGKTKNNTDDTTYQTYQIGTSVSDCSPGSGLSQYGAQGMAMKGYTYREILAAYYGIGTSGFDLGSVDSTNDTKSLLNWKGKKIWTTITY